MQSRPQAGCSCNQQAAALPPCRNQNSIHKHACFSHRLQLTETLGRVYIIAGTGCGKCWETVRQRWGGSQAAHTNMWMQPTTQALDTWTSLPWGAAARWGGRARCNATAASPSPRLPVTLSACSHKHACKPTVVPSVTKFFRLKPLYSVNPWFGLTPSKMTITYHE
jgi:hypothetical protein